MKRWLVLLIPLLLNSLALAAGIEGPDKIDAYKLIRHSAAQPAAWEIEPADKVDVEQSADGKAVTWIAPPGTYKVLAIIIQIDFEKKTYQIRKEKKQVVVGEAGPLPPSPQPPGPHPGGKYQVMFIFESNDLDNLPPGQREILAGLTFRKTLADKGHLIRGFFDKDSAAGALAEVAPFFAAVDGKSLPRIALSPYEGGKIETFPLPADPAGLWKLLADPKGAAIDRDFLQKNHWRLSPGTCGMLGCAAHGGGWILEKGGE